MKSHQKKVMVCRECHDVIEEYVKLLARLEQAPVTQVNSVENPSVDGIPVR